MSILRRYLLFALCVGFVPDPAAGQGFYDVNTIHTIELTFTQSNWDKILDSLYARGLNERLLGNAVIDGVAFDSVGVRYKGNSTYNPNRVKNPFNIKLDYVKSGQKIDGYGTLKLANSWSDPSFIREVLGYEIARKYMPAALCNYTNVHVNGSLIGLYVSVQNYDKLFLRTHFGNDERPFFEGIFDGFPTNLNTFEYLGEDSALYTEYFKPESDAGWTDLIDFLDTLNNTPAALDSVFDIDLNLWMLAYDFVLVNLDAPMNMYHNYYLYRDDADQFHPVIWDLNMNFGGFTLLVSTGSNLSLSQMTQLDPYTHAVNARYPLMNKVLTTDTRRRQYVAHMKTILAENFSNGWYESRGNELQNLINSSVQLDPYKFYSHANFLANLNSSVGGIVGIVPLMSGRTSYLSARTDFQATPPTISQIAHAPESPFANTDVYITAQVSGATLVQVNAKKGPSHKFQPIAMLDDGLHGDGSAGDGVWGAPVTAGITDLHYYIYAENSQAGVFEPARAAYVDSVIAVKFPSAVDLVINEFMADNAATAADQDGEFEDWIEIYNPTATSVSLRNCHLSDKIATPGKWTFPDTAIAAGSYLTVWADQDTTQAGLHANFGLSKSGEAVVLSDSATAIIDSVTFGPQLTDSSYSRCPNGTGSFRVVAATFGIANTCSCCVGLVGNVDCDTGGGVDISDVSRLIDHLFVSLSPLCCDEAANVDGVSGGGIDISDLTALIDYLFISIAPPPVCQ